MSMLKVMPIALEKLSELYSDNKTCAKLVGLSYIEDESKGLKRQKHGQGFSYHDSNDQILTDKILKQRITDLVIPPAWQEVWICPSANGHVLATGIDEKGRKQYIYHPKWRTVRDLIKFYRMIIFGKSLPDIRKTIDVNFRKRELGRDKVLGLMLWLLDNSYIRIGNEQYYEQNESVGLTTLTDKNLITAGSVVTLSFKGKSGKDQQITFDNIKAAKIIDELVAQRGTRLFRYKDGSSYIELDSDDINNYLHEISGVPISAKDFRTWGGTLMAFNHLVEAEALPAKDTPKPEKVIIQAVDAASNVLGNTRTVAKSSYIHPHILNAYGTKNFRKYYEKSQKQPNISGMDKRETELMGFLEQLFEDEFTLIKRT